MNQEEIDQAKHALQQIQDDVMLLAEEHDCFVEIDSIILNAEMVKQLIDPPDMP